jgi:hypothetical protein
MDKRLNRFTELVKMATEAPKTEKGESLVEIIGIPQLPLFYIYLN